MKKLVGLGITACMIALTSSQLYAADLKMGVVNMNTVLQKSPLMISLNNDLIKKFQARQNDLLTAQKQLQDETNQLNINAVNMSMDDRNKLQVKITNDQANVQILSASLQRDVAIAKDVAMQKFTAKVNDVIKGIAQTDKFDVIEQSNNFLFINSSIDITDRVVDGVK